MEKVVTSKNINYCEFTRSTDNMLTMYKKERLNILSTLINNTLSFPTMINNLVSMDTDCLCRMGKFIRVSMKDKIEGNPQFNPLLGNIYKCPQCVNIGRLTKLGTTNIRDPILLESGENAGSYVVVEDYDIQKISVNAVTGFNNVVISDPFTNNMLINYYINYIEDATSGSTRQVNKRVRKLHTAFICGKTGYMLYDLPKYKTVNDIPELSASIVEGILDQLFAGFDMLSKYQFVYGDITTSNIMFDDKPCNYIHDGKHISCPVTLKLTGFYDSSITVFGVDKHIRLLKKSNVVSNSVTLNSIVTETDDYYSINNGQYNPQIVEIYKYLTSFHGGKYSKSFNIYSTFTVLMSNLPFYSIVMEDSKLRSIWYSLWDSNEIDRLNAILENGTSRISIYMLLSKFKMKCNPDI